MAERPLRGGRLNNLSASLRNQEIAIPKEKQGSNRT